MTSTRGPDPQHAHAASRAHRSPRRTASRPVPLGKFLLKRLTSELRQADMRQSRGAAAELDGEASHQSDGLAPTSKRRMQRRSPRPADAELTLLELCACRSVTCRGGSAELQVTSHAVPSLSASRLLFARYPLLLTRGL